MTDSPTPKYTRFIAQADDHEPNLKTIGWLSTEITYHIPTPTYRLEPADNDTGTTLATITYPTIYQPDNRR